MPNIDELFKKYAFKRDQYGERTMDLDSFAEALGEILSLLVEAQVSTQIILKNGYGEFAVKINKTDMNIGEMFDDLIKPVLLAAGYAEETIDKMLAC